MLEGVGGLSGGDGWWWWMVVVVDGDGWWWVVVFFVVVDGCNVKSTKVRLRLCWASDN